MPRADLAGGESSVWAGTRRNVRFSDTVWAIRALGAAAHVGIEIPDVVWQRAQAALYAMQAPEGLWRDPEDNRPAVPRWPRPRPRNVSVSSNRCSSITTVAHARGRRRCRRRRNSGGGSTSPWNGSAMLLAPRPMSAPTTCGWPPVGGGQDWGRPRPARPVRLRTGRDGHRQPQPRRADWYKDAAGQILDCQREDGSWGDVPRTALAITFLMEGRSVPLIGKLRIPGRGGTVTRRMWPT